MSIGLLFWILMLFWIIFGLYWNRADYQGWVAGNLLLFVLLALLGWHAFGPMLHG